jgi:hypothetical protein
VALKWDVGVSCEEFGLWVEQNLRFGLELVKLGSGWRRSKCRPWGEGESGCDGTESSRGEEAGLHVGQLDLEAIDRGCWCYEELKRARYVAVIRSLYRFHMSVATIVNFTHSSRWT